jgi:hypothetical protein
MVRTLDIEEHAAISTAIACGGVTLGVGVRVVAVRTFCHKVQLPRTESNRDKITCAIFAGVVEVAVTAHRSARSGIRGLAVFREKKRTHIEAIINFLLNLELEPSESSEGGHPI